MASNIRLVIGKIIYGAVFVVGVPVLLIVWARMTESKISLPAFESFTAGTIIGGIGAVVMVAGMAAIHHYGHGLPMNAYPPARFVSEGVYGLMPHPIYTGFCVLCLGVAIAAGSASGLWLIVPAVITGCIALVQGYEKDAIRAHFGKIDARPFIGLPADEEVRATWSDRISAYALGIFPFLGFVAVSRVVTEQAGLASLVWQIDLNLPFEEWPQLIYSSRFLLILLVPLALRTSRELREFLIYAAAATGLACLLFVAFPHGYPLAPPASQRGVWAVLAWDPKLTFGPIMSLAAQAVLILIAAKCVMPKRPIFAYFVAILVLASGLSTGLQTVPSIVAGVGVFVFILNIRNVWEFLRSGTEHVANSWREWRWGPVRIINHGFYAAAGAFVSLAIIGVLVGPANVPYVILIALLSVVMSALTAQWIEGSPKLLRPYGWYGGVLGSLIGGFTAYGLGSDLWLLGAAFCVGAPWVQAAGRLRCLVQGCCHGRITDGSIGIRYTHPMSRVCKISQLKDEPVHPTPLYSILFNVLVAAITARLWLSGASLTLIVGLYYILTGMGRFVEESLRGEPQTPVFAGLRLYQALAILSVVTGIFMTMIPGAGNAPPLEPSWQALAASAVFAGFIFLAFGVDVPSSNRRFARLA